MILLFLLTQSVQQTSKPAPAQAYQIPYKLAATNHILLRAKLNGKGPYNFIMDTGAPALFIAEDVARKAGIQPDSQHWGMVNKLEIEGGAVIANAKGRVEGPFQLQAMNQLALTGVQIHGVIGYNVLARYKISVDMTKPKMTWIPVSFVPPPPAMITPAERKKIVQHVQNEKQMESMAKMASTMFAKKPAEVEPRGFLGIEMEPGTNKIEKVLAGSPAAQSGLESGDKVTGFTFGQTVAKGPMNADKLVSLLANLTIGGEVKFEVARGAETKEITVRAGKGGL